MDARHSQIDHTPPQLPGNAVKCAKCEATAKTGSNYCANCAPRDVKQTLRIDESNNRGFEIAKKEKPKTSNESE